MPSIPRIDFSDLKFPEIKLPDVKLPECKMPDLDLPEIDLPDADQITSFARDAAYVGIGLVVMTAERLQSLVGKVNEKVRETV